MNIKKDSTATFVNGVSLGSMGGSVLALVTGLAVVASTSFNQASGFAQSSYFIGICGLVASPFIGHAATCISKINENSHNESRGIGIIVGLLVPLILMAASSNLSKDSLLNKNPPASVVLARPPFQLHHKQSGY